MNKAQITGNVGKDGVILRNTRSGKRVANFSLAQNTTYRDGNKTKRKTRWFKVTLWEEQAVRAYEELQKGSYVSVVGNVLTEIRKVGAVEFKTTLLKAYNFSLVTKG